MQEKINRILALGDRIGNKLLLTEDEKRLLITTYKEVTGIRKKDGCGSCYVEIYLYFNKHKTIEIMQKDFLLKDRTAIYTSSDVLIRDSQKGINNVTTEKALQALKENPRTINKFEIFPENWEQLVASYDPMQKVIDKRKTNEVAVPQKEAEKETELDPLKLKREGLEEKTRNELIDFLKECHASDADKYPKSEWQNKNKKDLVEYIMNK
jgi:hypothetical protein